MKVAVLPFNAAADTRPALARQFANFACETVRTHTGADLHPVNYLAQIEQEGQSRAAYVNVAEALTEYEFVTPLFEQVGVDKVMDGLLKADDTNFDLTVRFHGKDSPEPLASREYKFTKEDLFGVLHQVVAELAAQAGVELPDHMRERLDMGTDEPDAFLRFLEGYDAFTYIQQSNGMVALEFQPKPAFDSLLEAVQLDGEFLAPYETLVQLCRACTHYRIGDPQDIEASLKKLAELEPDDFRASYALGEFYQALGMPDKAVEAYEVSLEAHAKLEEERKQEGLSGDWEQEEASLLTRIGQMQLQLGMPVNAERNFRRAAEYSFPENVALDFLTQVLYETNRQHEVAPLWKKSAESNPEQPMVHAKYGLHLVQTGSKDEGFEVLEAAIERFGEEALPVKRVFAPLLAQHEQLDRAMDMYEDFLDQNPNDIATMLEYAQTLQAGKRDFEVPQVLKQVLASNPDPNTRAQALAWLTELEQPKRTEVVEAAEKKIGEGNYAEAIRDLKPLRNWLADYWKLWALLAAAHNRNNEPEEGKEAAERLLGLFPGCEPGYAELTASLTAMQKHEEAYNVMRYAAAQMPNSLNIHVNLMLAAKRAGHTDEARTLAKRIREAVGENEQLEQILAEVEA